MALLQLAFPCPRTEGFIGAIVLTSSTFVHIFVAIIGVGVLSAILMSVVHVALMNRHDMDILAYLTSRAVHKLIGLRVRSARKYEESQQTLQWFFGTYILSLIAVYFLGAMTAFAFLYWGAGAVTGWNQAFIAAGSGLTTLGFATPTTHVGQWLAIPEGALGLGIVVFLFTFIPGFQTAIGSRDDQTAWLYARLTTLRNQADLFAWFNRVANTHDARVWERWEGWFRLLADSHVQSPVLSVVPSVQKGQSWVIAAAIVLDAAAFSVSTIGGADAESAKMCAYTGSRAVSLIAQALAHTTSRRKKANRDISRKAYDHLCARLSERGVALKADHDSSWAEFVRLRSQYAGCISYLAERAFVPLVDTFGVGPGGKTDPEFANGMLSAEDWSQSI